MDGYDNDDTDAETNGDDTPITLDVDGVTILSAGRNVVVQGIAADDSIFKITGDRVRLGALPGCCWQVAAAKAGTAGTIVEFAAGAVDGEVYGLRTVSGSDADGYDELFTITATSHGAYIHDCLLVGNTTDTDEGVVIGGTADRVRIEDNVFIDCGAGSGNIYSAAIFTNAIVRGNKVLERGTSKKGIIFTANGTGLLDENFIYVDTDANAIDPGAMQIGGNYINDASTTSQWISPAIGSAT